jgi:hypothetical protein
LGKVFGMNVFYLVDKISCTLLLLIPDDITGNKIP